VTQEFDWPATPVLSCPSSDLKFPKPFHYSQPETYLFTALVNNSLLQPI